MPYESFKTFIANLQQKKIHPEKIRFKIDEIKCIASIYLFLYNSHFTLAMSQEIHNFTINMTGEFVLFQKNTAIRSYYVRGLKISKELKGLSEDLRKFLKKTTYVKYYFKQIHNPQASTYARKLDASQVFYVQFHRLKFQVELMNTKPVSKHICPIHSEAANGGVLYKLLSRCFH